MNAFADRLNDLSGHWWSYTAHVTWQSSLVAIVIVTAVSLGRRWPSPLRSALVLVAFAKFALPPMLPAFVGVFSLFAIPGDAPVLPPETPVSPPAITEVVVTAESGSSILEVPMPEAPSPMLESQYGLPNFEIVRSESAAPNIDRAMNLNWRAMLMVIHLTGIAFMLAWVAGLAVRLHRLARRGVPIEGGPARSAFEEASRAFQRRRRVALLESASAATPMAFGVFWPKIVLPSSIVARLGHAELRAICAHEFAHHQRFDPLMSCLQCLIISLWWFNPVVWVLGRTARSVREDCCDDLILHDEVTTSLDYCQSLVRTAELFADRPARLHALDCAERMHPLKSRMLRVMDRSLARAPRLTVLGIAGIAMTSAIILPGLRSTAQDAAAESPDKTAPIPEASGPDNIAATDPLPPGAIARLGSTRYRSGSQGGLVILPDNRTLVTASGFWDLQSGRRLKAFASRVDVQQVVLSPKRDQLATVGSTFNAEKKAIESWLRFWDLEGNPKSAITWVESMAEVRSLVFSPDQQVVATGASTGVVRIWDLASGRELKKNRFAPQVETLAFSPDGSTLAAGGTRGVVFWNWKEGDSLEHVVKLDRPVTYLQFAPAGDRLAIVCDDIPFSVLLFDRESRKTSTLPMSPRNSYRSENLLFTKNGSRLIVPVGNGDIEIWNVATRSRERVFKTHSPGRHMAALSDDGQWLAAASSQSHALQVWNFKTGETLENATTHEATIRSIRFTPDGSRVVTAAFDGTVRIWDAATGREQHVLRHNARPVVHIAVSPDGRRIASSAFGDSVRVWDIDSGRQILSLEGNESPIVAPEISFNDDSRRLLTFGPDMFLHGWDLETGKAVVEHGIRPRGFTVEEGADGGAIFDSSLGERGFGNIAHTGRFSADGKSLLLMTPVSVRTFDVATGMEGAEVVPAARTGSIAISPDRQWMVLDIPGSVEEIPLVDGQRRISASKHHRLAIQQFDTGKVIHEILLDDGYYSIPVVSPDRRWIAIAMRAKGGPLLVFDSSTGEERCRIADDAIDGSVMAFSPDGNQIAAATANGTATIWDLQQFPANR